MASDDFKSDWNAADVYVKTLMTDYWMVKQNLYANDVREALDWLVQYFDDLSPVLKDSELREASGYVDKARDSVEDSQDLTTREQYFGQGNGVGGDEIRRGMRYLLRKQREKGLLIPGKTEGKHWDPEEFARKSDL